MIVKRILVVLGILFLLYGISVGSAVAKAVTESWWVWIILAVLCFLFAGYLHLTPKAREALHIPRWVFVASVTTVLFFGVLFLYTQARILTATSVGETEEEADYLIILGTGIEGTDPGSLLKMRLDEALSYWREHPHVKFLVTGGKGEGESYTESDVMAYYLINHGVPDERIIKESEALNTVENFRNSAELLPNKFVRARIVTSDFHVFRSEKIAKKQGFTRAEGLPAPSDSFLYLHYTMREFFAIMKDFLLGNM